MQAFAYLETLITYGCFKKRGVPQTMGKVEPSDQEIRNWIKDGWTFRVKTVKGRRYISRRLGSETDKGLGPFNQVLWDRLLRIKRESDEFPQRKSLMERFLFLLEINRASQNSLDCLNRDEEGFCNYWRWVPDANVVLFNKGIETKQVKDKDGARILFRAGLNYCMACNAYVSTRMKKFLA